MYYYVYCVCYLQVKKAVADDNIEDAKKHFKRCYCMGLGTFVWTVVTLVLLVTVLPVTITLAT